jgi:hypothetical protein
VVDKPEIVSAETLTHQGIEILAIAETQGRRFGADFAHPFPCLGAQNNYAEVARWNMISPNIFNDE